MSFTEARLDRFSRRCEKRTDKALKRMDKYEKKISDRESAIRDSVSSATKSRKHRKSDVSDMQLSPSNLEMSANAKIDSAGNSGIRNIGSRKAGKKWFDDRNISDSVTEADSSNFGSSDSAGIGKPGIRTELARTAKENAKRETRKGLGKEPLLDSLRTTYDFADKTGMTSDPSLATRHSATMESIDRAQGQLDETVDVKEQLHRRTAEAKARAKGHPEYARTVGKMEKEEYYYTAQVNEYRKSLRDPAAAEQQLMQAARKDPRWSEYAAALPPLSRGEGAGERLQPKDMVKKMMQSQASAVDPDGSKLLADAQKQSGELLGMMSEQSTEFGNLDNAAQMPSFTPNPYKTKSFWERIDAGFNLEFDGKTYFLPSCGVAGFQLANNIDKRWSAGALINYRFGMGEDIRHIRFSSMGAGYGVFVNGKVWKGLGAQAGFERNWRTEVKTTEELQFPAAWTSAALLGLTWEYGIGKRAKGTLGVFFDALHNSHTPQTNAILWRTGWKF